MLLPSHTNECVDLHFSPFSTTKYIDNCAVGSQGRLTQSICAYHVTQHPVLSNDAVPVQVRKGQGSRPQPLAGVGPRSGL